MSWDGEERRAEKRLHDSFTPQTTFGYIYKTTNLLNNKVYVGQHKGELEPFYFGGGLLIKKAINKIGKDNFKLEVLVYAKTKEELDKLEIEFIKDYRELCGKDNIYNIAKGGEGCGGNYHHRLNCTCHWCSGKRGELTGDKNPTARLEVRTKIGRASSKRMLENNPMKRPEVIAKSVKSRANLPRLYMIGNNNPMMKPDILAKMSGVNHWNWKGGITKEEHYQRDYKRKRKEQKCLGME